MNANESQKYVQHKELPAEPLLRGSYPQPVGMSRWLYDGPPYACCTLKAHVALSFDGGTHEHTCGHSQTYGKQRMYFLKSTYVPLNFF